MHPVDNTDINLVFEIVGIAFARAGFSGEDDFEKWR
jgi:hypothetical protein